ncbi:hypothetical protein ABZW18_32040 [Streptomyces sp. NPDC004647]|uniref:hypothetical protein n=1 Tax=Streptomyces sp. NPDC004647 TaxID=3154671 RepID=UPI0033A1C409
MRIYGIRHWIEQSYKQVKDELGWADFQVRSDTAIRRHQTLVNCAFFFCWDAWFDQPAPPEPPTGHSAVSALADRQDRPERGTVSFPPAPPTLLAPGITCNPQLADPLHRATTLVAGMVQRAPTHRPPDPDRRGDRRATSEPLRPDLTNHR